MDEKHCAGCRNNFYNNGGVNGGTKECWSLDGATLERKKEVHVSDQPPWKHNKIKKVPSCYSRPKYVYVDPDREK